MSIPKSRIILFFSDTPLCLNLPESILARPLFLLLPFSIPHCQDPVRLYHRAEANEVRPDARGRPGKTRGVFARIHWRFFRAENDAEWLRIARRSREVERARLDRLPDQDHSPEHLTDNSSAYGDTSFPIRTDRIEPLDLNLKVLSSHALGGRGGIQ